MRDEDYVIELCDRVLKERARRHYRFPFLVGDSGRMLPVDAYCEGLRLVVEYHERQHVDVVSFFDKPDRMTVSGISRGGQRRLYDQRRREVLPANGIALLELPFRLFAHDRRKRLLRREAEDVEILRRQFASFLRE